MSPELLDLIEQQEAIDAALRNRSPDQSRSQLTDSLLNVSLALVARARRENRCNACYRDLADPEAAGSEDGQCGPCITEYAARSGA